MTHDTAQAWLHLGGGFKHHFVSRGSMFAAPFDHPWDADLICFLFFFLFFPYQRGAHVK